MKKFDWAKFEAGECRVHCDTQEKATAFLNKCADRGHLWSAGNEINAETTYWDTYGENTLYSCSITGPGMCFCDIGGLADTKRPKPIVTYEEEASDEEV